MLGIKWQVLPIGSQPPQAQPKEGETFRTQKGARASGRECSQIVLLLAFLESLRALAKDPAKRDGDAVVKPTSPAEQGLSGARCQVEPRLCDGAAPSASAGGAAQMSSHNPQNT